MNVEIRTEAAQFLFWENIKSNFFAVHLYQLPLSSYNIQPMEESGEQFTVVFA